MGIQEGLSSMESITIYSIYIYIYIYSFPFHSTGRKLTEVNCIILKFEEKTVGEVMKIMKNRNEDNLGS
jgi:hypothetical protein